MTARLLPGEKNGKVLIVTDGVRFEVILRGGVPDWATLYWFLKDDPRTRPNWAGMRAIVKPDEKMSKSNA